MAAGRNLAWPAGLKEGGDEAVDQPRIQLLTGGGPSMFARHARAMVGLVLSVAGLVLLTITVNAADQPRRDRSKAAANRSTVQKGTANQIKARRAAAKQAAKQYARGAAQMQAVLRKRKEDMRQEAATQEAKTAAKSPAKRASRPAATKATSVAATTKKRGDSSAAKLSVAPMAIPAPLPPAISAAKADRLLTEAIPELATPVAAPQASDEVFLRRISLDVAGRLPTPAEIKSFVADPASGKRSAAVERLLAESSYGENWGRYWRDVIMYRRSDDRARIAVPALEEYLTTALNNNTSWDEIARAFITATGDVRDNGSTAIFMAQMGETSDIAAEISRVFTGIQIQCAQCHDHPTDRWERTQFHELAAFFPRIAVRPKRDATPRSFEVASADRAPRFRRPNAGAARGSQEHYMPDLDNPTARGTLMQPVFFIAGQELVEGATDMERRETLARWLTSPDNPWFAKAFVNRMWSELVGEGFYEPVDDIGPDRQATAPEVLDYLASQFVANKHDIKWLLRTITATAAYQRESRSRRGPEETPMLANVAQRLRADQLYTAVTSALGAPLAGRARRPGAGPLAKLRTPRAQFNTVFGYDPSAPRDEIAGAIPQALAVMNSPQLAAGMNGDRPRSMLGALLVDETDDNAVANELYLRTLSRTPTAKESEVALAYVKQAGSRDEGFEDVLWALVNSAEFMHRR
jgi:hypothetical protein